MIRVIFADDHPVVREGIQNILDNEIDIDCLASASSGKELLSLLDEHTPDIVVLDITMQEKSGLELIKDVKARFGQIPVLILTVHPAERFALRALKAGAKGYLCKTSITKELPKAIRHIVKRKKRYITDEVAEQLAGQVDQSSNRPIHEDLSDREFEIMCEIASGSSVTEIAEELSISPHTVHTYRNRIKEKMNLSSDVDMTRYVLNNDLIN